MGKRVFLTLPDGVAEDLERWAEAEGNKAASLAGFIVEQAVRQAGEQGKIPPRQRINSSPSQNKQPDSLNQLIEKNYSEIVQERVSEKRLKEILEGDDPCDLESARIALATGFSVEVVEELIAQHGKTKQRRKATNGA